MNNKENGTKGKIKTLPSVEAASLATKSPNSQKAKNKVENVIKTKVIMPKKK